MAAFVIITDLDSADDATSWDQSVDRDLRGANL